jgi:hypothetical protein
MLIQDNIVLPIDYANACPDVALTSLHYYFPWAMKALVRWTAFCAATGRKAKMQVDQEPWYTIADNPDLDYAGKLAAYQRLADAHFDTERYREFCATALPHVDDLVLEWVSSPHLDTLLVDTVRATYPAAEQEKFIAHFRGLVGLWVSDESSLLAS